MALSGVPTDALAPLAPQLRGQNPRPDRERYAKAIAEYPHLALALVKANCTGGAGEARRRTRGARSGHPGRWKPSGRVGG